MTAGRHVNLLSLEPRPKVVQVVSGLFWGGGQKVVFDLCRSFSNSSRYVVYLCLLGDKCPQLSRFAACIVPYDGSYNDIGTLLKLAIHVRRFVRQSHCSILHTHGVDADLVGALVSALTPKIRHVVHLHTVDNPLWGRSPSRYFRCLLSACLFRLAKTSFIAVSMAVARYSRKVYPINESKLVVVYNGVDHSDLAADYDRFSGRLGRRIGTACRLSPLKGIKYLLQTLKMLRAEFGSSVHLWIAGSGGAERKLRLHSERLGVSSAVRWLGHLSDLSQFYRSIDVFVLPSFSEGLPLVVLEAMAAGVPVVATRVGGVPEVIVDGYNGLLVDPGDSRGLAAAIARLLRDPGLRCRFAISGRKVVSERFTLQRMAAATASFYDSIMPKPI